MGFPPYDERRTVTTPPDAPPVWQDHWTFLGRTSNTANYVSGPLLIALPDVGARDDGAAARENAQSQLDYFAELGRPGVIAIFFDRLSHQDREARHAYSTMGGPETVRGIALIGGSLMTRALGSFFLGISQTQMPLKMFASYAEARPWLEECLGEPLESS